MPFGQSEVASPLLLPGTLVIFRGSIYCRNALVNRLLGNHELFGLHIRLSCCKIWYQMYMLDIVGFVHVL
jgi:hypothetical protein